MSLNRSEQITFDYLQGHPDEGQHWRDKVHALAQRSTDGHEAATQIEAELWAYFVERSAVAAPFRELAQREGGLRRTSMRNLAELFLRLWTAPRPKARAAPPTAPASP